MYGSEIPDVDLWLVLFVSIAMISSSQTAFIVIAANPVVSWAFLDNDSSTVSYAWESHSIVCRIVSMSSSHNGHLSLGILILVGLNAMLRRY